MAVRVLEGGGGERAENRWGPSESAGGGVCGSRRSRRSASGESMMRQYGLVEITNASAASGRFSSGTIATAISAGPDQRCSAWPATAPTPACPYATGSAPCQGIIAASAAASRCAPTTNSDQRPSHECSGRAPSHHPDVPLGRRGYHRRVGRAAQRRRADHRHQSAV